MHAKKNGSVDELAVIGFYNNRRPHSSLDGKPSRLVTAAIAIANKTARPAWAMLKRQESYRASAMA